MPRPNPPRSLQSEQNLARRIAHERESRGWSYEGVADRMTRAGCPIQSTAIYKIEKGDPPRRITVDELVGFSKVFDIPLDQLLVPPELVDEEALLDLLTDWQVWSRRALEAAEQEQEALDRVKLYASDRPDMAPKLQTFIRNWVEKWSADPDFAEARWMHTLTGRPEWTAKVKAEMDRIVSEKPVKTPRKAANRG